jgi:tRNA(Ile)-lysidine synthetase-like protein
MEKKEDGLTYDPESTYLLACTYGPDSMALLDMAYERGLKPVVLFVNYHTADSMEEEEKSLKALCLEKGLTIEALDTSSVDQTGREEDFVAWARKTRYSFFKKMYEKYNAAALLTAHNQDDMIENYLLKKKTGKNDEYGQGLTKISTYDGMILYRPLLDFSKADLIHYCKEHHVPFSEHMSLYEDQHTRSAIRTEVIDKMNEIDRAQVLNEIMAINDQKISFMKDLSSSTHDNEMLGIREIIALNKPEFASALIHFVSRGGRHVSLSAKQLDEIRHFCLDGVSCETYHIKGKLYLVKEYDILTLDDTPDDLLYTYVLDKPGLLSTKDFDLDFSKGAEDRNIHDSDYPLTIRSTIPGDEYILGGYLVPLRRMFIDADMPARLRKIWPVFLNKDGKIVYVPRYRKSFKEYHTSKLVIHVTDEEK